MITLATCVGRANADFTFGEPVNLGPVVNTTSVEASTSTSADHLELYFSSNRPGGFGDLDIWVAVRPSVTEPWGPPVNLDTPVNTPYVEAYPSLSADGLTLYFSDLYSGTPRPGGLGGADIWMTTRASRNDPWATPVNVGAPVNSSAMEVSPTVSGDGLILVFASSRTGTGGPYDLWLSERSTVHAPWGAPVNLGATVNSPTHGDLECSLSADGLALFFASGRPGGLSNYDLWMTTRKSRQAPWTPTVNCGPFVNSSSTEGAAGVSADMRTLYFDSDRPGGSGGYDLWAAAIMPTVDFNGDGTVDTDDLVRLIESWGQDDPSVDIGPGPWGDGVVDAADLEILMSYWGQEIPGPDLIAHWRLDETEGTVAADSVAGNDGIVTGVPLWRADGGQVGGALELDGACSVVTEFVLDPSDGPFSVFAWVQGGAPGQVLISQVDGADWLAIDAAQGTLTTALAPAAGRKAIPPLVSEAVITDGNWHRVAFVWDGITRALYGDDALVAEDTQSSLASCTGGLNIGCGKDMTPGSFFTGLIDDVRVYDRVVRP